MAMPFDGAREYRHSTKDAEIFALVGGEGPPLLLLHGFPQTHAMWHPVAPALMQQFTCVMPDLRGYGASSCPPNTPDNSAYSKRAMAEDMLSLMRSLGHSRFAVVGHDRGGRVAYRLALDHPGAPTCLCVLDIVPTSQMWREFTVDFAMKTYHWLFLAQPAPLPEMLLEKAPVAWIDYTIANWSKTKDLSAFDPRALDDYRESFARPEHIHAMCNDYRAGATYDRSADEADREAGRKIACPTLTLWGDAGFPSETSGPLDTWRDWCVDVVGAGIDAGHFVVEENPMETLGHLMPFLRRYAA
ncbi:MAG TPA: alpha/beta hydrolase [Rhizobiaceae bacterium]|nr:alpha/beta hydrolase [Rhizobiaceae bacterium]